MMLRNLGKNGPQVPVISIGCWSFGGSETDYWGAQDQTDVDQLVSAALDLGVNFFDTAYGYNEGRSEISLGKALAGKRQKAIICTKTPIQPSGEVFEEKLKLSLERLGTDYVDVLMIHWPTRDRELLSENLVHLKRMVEKGLVRFAGVSNFGVETMRIAKEVGLEVVANEFAYSLISRAPEYEVLPYCLENGIGLVSYMSLMQGILTGKYSTIEEIPINRRRTCQFDVSNNPAVDVKHKNSPADAEVLEVIAALRRLAPEAGLTVAQLALAWCVSKPSVATAFVGMRNLAQLNDNIKAGHSALHPDIVKALDDVSLPVLNKMGNITDIFGRDRIW